MSEQHRYISFFPRFLQFLQNQYADINIFVHRINEYVPTLHRLKRIAQGAEPNPKKKFTMMLLLSMLQQSLIRICSVWLWNIDRAAVRSRTNSPSAQDLASLNTDPASQSERICPLPRMYDSRGQLLKPDTS